MAKLTYEIKPNGYVINRDGRPWISQLEPYGKLFVPNGTYEENAQAHIEDLEKPAESQVDQMDEIYSALDDLAQTVGNLVKGE